MSMAMLHVDELCGCIIGDAASVGTRTGRVRERQLCYTSACRYAGVNAEQLAADGDGTKP